MNKLDKDSIASILLNNGPMGVTSLAAELDVPVSTLQKYLTTQQVYFVQNESRQWTVPEAVKSGTRLSTITKLAELLQTNTELLQAFNIDIATQITSNLDTIQTLRKFLISYTPANEESTPSVAHPRLVELNEGLGDLEKAIKKNKKNIPEEYYALLINFDYIQFLLKVGSEKAQEFMQEELLEMIINGGDELSDEAIDILKEYEKK